MDLKKEAADEKKREIFYGEAVGMSRKRPRDVGAHE
jgi:hypothetical protein